MTCISAQTTGRSSLRVRHLGLAEYDEVWARMRTFTDSRGASTTDEVWMVEHPPVYTLGQAASPDHILGESAIAVVRTDRGGQVTYHGPGQQVAYILLDLKRRKLGVRSLVCALEQSVIDMLAGCGIEAGRKERAPGVYVEGRKVAALGLRVRGGCSYHGIAINVSMDLRPFDGIDPCGYRGLEVTQLADLGLAWSVDEAGAVWLNSFCRQLNYDVVTA